MTVSDDLLFSDRLLAEVNSYIVDCDAAGIVRPNYLRLLKLTRDCITMLEADLRVTPGQDEIADLNEHIEQQEKYIANLRLSLSHCRVALRELVDYLVDNDEEGLIEHARPIINARDALKDTKP